MLNFFIFSLQTPAAQAAATKVKGNKYFKGGKFDQAIRCYTEAIDLCPEDNKTDLATYYQNRAAAHEQQVINFSLTFSLCIFLVFLSFSCPLSIPSLLLPSLFFLSLLVLSLLILSHLISSCLVFSCLFSSLLLYLSRLVIVSCLLFRSLLSPFPYISRPSLVMKV